MIVSAERLFGYQREIIARVFQTDVFDTQVDQLEHAQLGDQLLVNMFSRVDKQKDEVVVELLEAAVPIPITVKLDSVKVIRRESDSGEKNEQGEN